MQGKPLNRRRFIKTSLLGLFGTSGIPGINLKAAGITSMAYRQLGRTRLMISEISLGGSPVPPEPVFKRALELGVNYVDTSATYQRGNSERLIGKLIKGKRDKIHVSTKFHPGRLYHSRSDLIKEVEGSLQRLDSDYIDVLQVHGASDSKILADEEVLAAFDQLKKAGKIRFTGVSCHKNPVEVLLPAIASGNYDMLTVAYNAYSGTRVEKDGVYADYLVRSGMEQVLKAARRHNIGIVAMKTLAGGDRQKLEVFKSGETTLTQAKLKWVLQNKAVAAIITEMVNFEYLHENIAASNQPFTAGEKNLLAQHVNRTSVEVCRMCGECQRQCPNGIPVPDILRYGLYHEAYGKRTLARAAYQKLNLPRLDERCLDCYQCQRACPYGVNIREKLIRYHRLLS